MASNFNDNPTGPGLAPDAPAADSPAAEPGTTAAFIRFRSCRWQQPAEGGSQEFCTHREVKPYAGTQGFDPDAWCPECTYYKLRRAPKKRTPDDDFGY